MFAEDCLWTKISQFGIKLLLGFLCCLLLWGCQPATPPAGRLVRVSRVVSGQTLEVLDPAAATANTERVRLLGIDAPAWKQEPWYTNARNQLETLIGTEKTVVLESDVEPTLALQDGSLLQLAYVWKGSQFINERMLAEGHGLAGVRSPNLKYAQRLTRAQERARLLGRGIWDPVQPMRQTPDEFRKHYLVNP